MTGNRKILLSTSCYPRSEDDNSGIFLRYLAQHLAASGLDIHILVPDGPKPCSPPDDRGVTVHRFRYLPRSWQRLAFGSGILPNLRRNQWLLLQVPLFLLGQFFALLYWSGKLRPALLHAHWILPQGLLAIPAGKLFKIPVMITAHGGDAFALQGGINGWLKRWALVHAKYWTANSPSTAAAVHLVAQPAVIIPMGVETALFHPGSGPNPLSRTEHNRYTLLFVGRLVEKKGLRYLLEAFAKLPATFRSASQLLIAGDGALKAELVAQSQSLGLETQVRFLGMIPNRQLPAWYAAVDLFIAPSIQDRLGDREGLGVILLEAMACGTPVIASASGGICDVLKHRETGLLVPPADADTLAITIEQALADPALRQQLAENGLRLIQRRYRWQSVSQQFQSLYQQAIAQHRHSRS